MPNSPARDLHQRPLRSLRVSVTDRCNLRCDYCMPEENYVWLPRPHLLTFEEIDRVVGAFTAVGVDKVRITGGEPLVRHDVHQLIRLLAKRQELVDLAMTTNGVLLDRHVQDLRDAGLQRLTVSLDTLDPRTFRLLTRRDELARVLAGIDAAKAAGLGEGLKIDTVVMRGVNDGELLDLLHFGRKVGAEVRFIEYMDVGGATRWSSERVVPRAEILATIGSALGPTEPIRETDAALAWAPADRYRLPDGSVFGVISSTTQPFCGTCDRSRLTADGHWFTCLYGREGDDLRALVRDGICDEDLAAHIAKRWGMRRDRGAEQRVALRERGVLADAATLQQDPHLEMHTRGG